MADVKELIERQKNEVCALQSIFGSYFVDLREKENTNHLDSSYVPPLIRITLLPQNSESQLMLQSDKEIVQIDFKIKCSINYPNEIPKFFLENEKRLTKDMIRELRAQVNEKAKSLIGYEMIYELCQVIQEFLYLKIPQTKENIEKQNSELLSLYEQRLHQKKSVEIEELNKLESINSTLSYKEMFAEIEEEVNAKRELIKKESKKIRLEKKENSLYALTQLIESDETDDTLSNDQFQSFELKFDEHKINVIQLKHCEQKYSFKHFLGIEVSTSKVMNVYEWNFKFPRDILKRDFLNQIYLMEQELICLKESSDGYFKDYGIKASSSENKKKLKLFMYSSFIEGVSLEHLIKQKFIMSYDAIKNFTKEVLKILKTALTIKTIILKFEPKFFKLENQGNLFLHDSIIINGINSMFTKIFDKEDSTRATMDLSDLGFLLLSITVGEVVNKENFYKIRFSDINNELKDFINILHNGETDISFLMRHKFLTKKIEAVDAIENIFDINHQKPNYMIKSEKKLGEFTDYSLQSRLNTEFEVIGVVGKGAFGEVLKVKNKFDMRFYAIKRIRINPNSNQLNKQIRREIDLLSRLNHDNIVRYYSTWFEKYGENELQSSSNIDTNSELKNSTDAIKNQPMDENDTFSTSGLQVIKKTADNFKDDSSSSSSSSTSSSVQSRKSSLSLESDSSGLFDNVVNCENFNVLLDLDKNEKFKKKCNILKQENSESVIFEADIEEKTQSSSSDDESKQKQNDNKIVKRSKKQKKIKSKDESVTPTKKHKNMRQFTYIQMEFCEGKTLRDLIDNQLHLNQEKVWKLFREILQGLSHIHEQGMIHRDLKPRNVLIDAHGHAKIGDFGLATSKIWGHENQAVLNQSQVILTQSIASASEHLDLLSLSGAVGTALYVAPELLDPSATNKYSYTKKVDIYSLGIMFYEMCFPFETEMERVSVLKNLRNASINFPPEIDLECYSNQYLLIKAMLDHDPTKRPSAEELLESELIPQNPNEKALDKLLKESLENKKAINYGKIIKAVFEQVNTPGEDASYDLAKNFHNSFKYLKAREYTYSKLIKIFQNNGAFMISTGLLMPWNELCNEYEKAFHLVDASGMVLTLPYNHTVPFARFISRNENENFNMKRYFIGNVYEIFSENFKLIGLHPKEKIEAVFDIVSSNNSDLPEIEILVILNEIISSFPEITDKEFRLVLNHGKLVNSILLNYGIKEKDLKKIYSILCDYNMLFNSQIEITDESVNWMKERLKDIQMNSFPIEKVLNSLLKFGSIDQVISAFEKTLIDNEKTEVSKLFKEAYYQLSNIKELLSMFNLKFSVVLTLSLVLPSSAHPFAYDGLVFKLLFKKKMKKNLNAYDILAYGGRYDRLIRYFSTKNNSKHATGFSLDFDNLVTLINDTFNVKNEIVLFSNEITSTSEVNVSQLGQQLEKRKNLNQQGLKSKTESNNIIEIKNQLLLYKHLKMITKESPLFTYLLHNKFESLDDMRKYCEKHKIFSYVYMENDAKFINMSHLNFTGINQTLKLNVSQGTSSKVAKISSKQVERRVSLDDFVKNTSELINATNAYINANNQLNQLAVVNLLQYQNITMLSTVSTSSSTNTSNTTFQTNSTSSLTSNTSYENLSSSLNSQLTLPGYQNTNSSTSLNMPYINFIFLTEGSNSGSNNLNFKRIESQIISKVSNLCQLFSQKTRIELIAIDTTDLVIQTIVNSLNLDTDEQSFNTNWSLMLKKINLKLRKQIINLKLDDILKELKYNKRSRVFIFYSLKNEVAKLIVSA